MADVFIFYKSERRRAARHLEQILVRNGYTVWFDHALVRGHDYEEQIQQQIEAAKAVVVLWCTLSVTSTPVRSEANFAKSKGTQIPIQIEDCTIPLFSSLTQYIDLRAWSGAPRDALFDAVLDDIERHTGKKPVYDRDVLREFERGWRDNGAFALSSFPLESVAIPQPVLILIPDVATVPRSVSALEWPSIRDSRDIDRIVEFKRVFEGTPEATEATSLLNWLMAEHAPSLRAFVPKAA